MVLKSGFRPAHIPVGCVPTAAAVAGVDVTTGGVPAQRPPWTKSLLKQRLPSG